MRLFVALELPETLRGELDRRGRSVRSRLPEARWVRPETLHLTLAFLGDTPAERISGLDLELGAAFARFAPMTLRVTGAGAFPPRGPKRVVWAGIESDGDLAGLRRAVGEAVYTVTGTPAEKRRFHPHVTLARCRPPWPAHRMDELEAAFEGGVGEPFEVTSGTLFESRLGPAGAKHTAVSNYPLGGGGEESG